MFLLWSMFAFLLVGWAWPKSHQTCEDMYEVLKFSCPHLNLTIFGKRPKGAHLEKNSHHVYLFPVLWKITFHWGCPKRRNIRFPWKVNHWTEGGWGLCICHPFRKTTSDGEEMRPQLGRWSHQLSLESAGEKGFLWTCLKKKKCWLWVFCFTLD